MSSTSNDDLAKRLARAERDWQSMQRICHDFFHGWRQAVQDRYGVEAAKTLELDFYGRVGEGSGKMFLDRGGKPQELEKLVRSLVRASEVMGESAHMACEGNDILLVHTACPWLNSFRDTGASNQCQAGCDHWFKTTARTVSANIRVVTESALPAGDATCTRRFSAA